MFDSHEESAAWSNVAKPQQATRFGTHPIWANHPQCASQKQVPLGRTGAKAVLLHPTFASSGSTDSHGCATDFTELRWYGFVEASVLPSACCQCV